MRRFRSSIVSTSVLFVVTSPSTTTLSFGTNRSGSKLPARSLSYSSISRLWVQLREELLGDVVVVPLAVPLR